MKDLAEKARSSLATALRRVPTRAKAAAVIAALALIAHTINTSAIDDTPPSGSETQDTLLALERIVADAARLNAAVRSSNWDAAGTQTDDLLERIGPRGPQDKSPTVAAARELVIASDRLLARVPYHQDAALGKVAAAHDRVLSAARTQRAQLTTTARDAALSYEDRAHAAQRSAHSAAFRALFIGAAAAATLVLLFHRPPEPKQPKRENNPYWETLATIGPSMRRSMNIIMGFASVLIHDEPDQETTREHARTIYAASTSLKSTIEDIEDLSSIESSSFKITRTNANPKAVLERLEKIFAPRAADKGIGFVVEIDGSCPQSVQADTTRLEQVVSKLLGNAITFTDSGQVELHAALEQHDGADTLVVRVIDSGTGIPSDKIGPAFDPFVSAVDETHEPNRGVGLGLTVARAIARELGGDIELESTQGVGTFASLRIDLGAFSFDPAAAPDTTTELPSADPRALEDAHVLIVEDGADNLRLMSHHLAKAGCTVHTAADGKEGLDKVLNAAKDNDPFALVLMDLEMPVMDGYESTQRIREAGIDTPIVAVSAHTADDEKQRAHDAGCSAYFTKPIRKPELIDTCARWIAQTSVPSTREAA